MLQFLGENPAQAKSDADRILALEIAMAKPRFDRVERRDSRKSYNPMSVVGLQKLMPSIAWDTYLTGIGLPKIDSVIVSQPKYLAALDGIFKENKVEDWKEIAQAMRKEYFPTKPQLNMKRDTEEMSTSSQTVMNLTDKILQITYFKSKVNEFKGINRQLPEGYQPKITIEVIPV